MTKPISRPTDPDIRATSRGLGNALEAKIIKAIALVDSLPHRGAADEDVLATVACDELHADR